MKKFENNSSVVQKLRFYLLFYLLRNAVLILSILNSTTESYVLKTDWVISEIWSIFNMLSCTEEQHRFKKISLLIVA